MHRPVMTFLIACLALLGLCGVTSSALAAETRHLGNTDGKAFTAACPDGLGIVGFAYNYSDTQLLAVTPLCRVVDATGNASGVVPKAGSFKGASGGSGAEPIVCKNDQAVRGLEVYLTKNTSIFAFRPVCDGPGGPVTARTYSLPYDNAHQPSTSHAGVDCGSHFYTTALVGTYKDTGSQTTSGILSIGLVCQKEGEEPAPAAAKGGGDDEAEIGDDLTVEHDGPAAAGGDGAIRFDVDIGDLIDGIAGGGKGKLSFAEVPTTIYQTPAGKEIAYLDKGEKVTIVGCEDGGDGWCQISKPKKGYVWGPDLH